MPKTLALYLEREAEEIVPCWEIRHCSIAQRENCPAWRYEAYYYCWRVTGNICQGKIQRTWGEKMALCQQCDVFQPMILKRSKS